MTTALPVSDTRIALQGEAFAADGPTSEVEVILSGNYKARNLNIDEKAIDSMIANHKACGVDPAVDREHESWSSLQLEPSPAMGWVKALSKRPSSADPSRMALVATVEWTDVGSKAVAAKHYRYISAGMDLAAKDRRTGQPIGVMLDHVALVKHPFVQGMQPLSLSATPQENRMNSVFKALGLKEDATEADAVSALSALADRNGAKDAEIIALKAQNTASDARIAALEANAKAERLERLTAALDAKIEAFAVDPGERDALIELAKASPETFTKLLALRTPRDPSGPRLKVVSDGKADRLALQNKAIEDRMKLTGAEYDEAFIALATENPSLFNEVA